MSLTPQRIKERLLIFVTFLQEGTTVKLVIILVKTLNDKWRPLKV